MDISKAEQKQIENEMIFRRKNERVAAQLAALNKMYEKDAGHDLGNEDDLPLMFKCECSDENCEERIQLQLSKYQKIHANRSNFIVITDHEVDLIEKVVIEENGYNIVKKYNTTPEPNDTLKSTNVNNV